MAAERTGAHRRITGAHEGTSEYPAVQRDGTSLKGGTGDPGRTGRPLSFGHQASTFQGSLQRAYLVWEQAGG